MNDLLNRIADLEYEIEQLKLARIQQPPLLMRQCEVEKRFHSRALFRELRDAGHIKAVRDSDTYKLYDSNDVALVYEKWKRKEILP